MSLKKGDRVVVTGTNPQLRHMSCSSEMVTGSVHTIVAVSGCEYMLDVQRGPYINKGWVELYEDYADEDWV